MKMIYKKITIWVFIALFVPLSSLFADNQKWAQSSFQFLSVVSDARATAMGDAMTSLQMGSSALFFNPAGMAEMDEFIHISASLNQWIADINHNTYSLAFNPANGKYGVLGFTFQSVDYGEFYGTRVDKSTDKGYINTGMFELSAMAMGVGYAKQLSDRFSVGGQVRYVEQDLGKSMIPGDITYTETDTVQQLHTASSSLSPFAFDFGTQYKPGFKSLIFGMSVRNFSTEVKYVQESFQLPLVFNLGISMNLFDFWENNPIEQSLYAVVDASHYRSHPEQIKVGLEYTLMNMFNLRGGYVSSNSEDGVSFGVGVHSFGFAFDYAYTPFGVFGDVKKMTVRFAF